MAWEIEHCGTAIKGTLLLTVSTIAFSGMGAILGLAVGYDKDTPALEDAGFGALMGGSAALLIGVAYGAFLVLANLCYSAYHSEESTPLLGSNSSGWFSRLSNRLQECLVKQERDVEPYPTTGL